MLNNLKADLNPISYFLALLRAHHILNVSRVRVKADNLTNILCRFSWNIGPSNFGNPESLYAVCFIFTDEVKFEKIKALTNFYIKTFQKILLKLTVLFPLNALISILMYDRVQKYLWQFGTGAWRNKFVTMFCGNWKCV